MILAFNHRHACHIAGEQVQDTGMRQRISKRRIVNASWWTVEQLDEPVGPRKPRAIAPVIYYSDRQIFPQGTLPPPGAAGGSLLQRLARAQGERRRSR
ncbi:MULTISPECIES: hypothetical protein [unclassified Aeromicrobium]|uniref:hypothetical protein n=1 Tax=unclassified Aeromicrobium TaxID=2633570 RepID=UPI00288A97A6|nr:MULTISPECIES: hypothetical protein [unclassified Aeromicrobium]